MGNILKDGLDYVKQTAWDQPVGILKDVGKGDFKAAGKDFQHTFGDNERAESKLFKDAGIRGWVGDHPEETAGAVVASIFGGWAAAGAYGAGAAGTAGAGAAGAGGAGAGAAGGGALAGGTTGITSGALSGVAGSSTAAATAAPTAASTGASIAGGSGASAYMAPAASGGIQAGGFSSSYLTTQGAAAAQASMSSGGALAAEAPATSSLLTAGHAGAAGMGSATGTVEGAASAVPSTFQTSSLGNVSSVKSAETPHSTDWDYISRTLKSVQNNNEKNQPKASAPQMAPSYRANWRGSKVSGNPLLQKTMQELYNQPLQTQFPTLK